MKKASGRERLDGEGASPDRHAKTATAKTATAKTATAKIATARPPGQVSEASDRTVDARGSRERPARTRRRSCTAARYLAAPVPRVLRSEPARLRRASTGRPEPLRVERGAPIGGVRGALRRAARTQQSAALVGAPSRGSPQRPTAPRQSVGGDEPPGHGVIGAAATCTAPSRRGRSSRGLVGAVSEMRTRSADPAEGASANAPPRPRCAEAERPRRTTRSGHLTPRCDRQGSRSSVRVGWPRARRRGGGQRRAFVAVRSTLLSRRRRAARREGLHPTGTPTDPRPRPIRAERPRRCVGARSTCLRTMPDGAGPNGRVARLRLGRTLRLSSWGAAVKDVLRRRGGRRASRGRHRARGTGGAHGRDLGGWARRQPPHARVGSGSARLGDPDAPPHRSSRVRSPIAVAPHTLPGVPDGPSGAVSDARRCISWLLQARLVPARARVAWVTESTGSRVTGRCKRTAARSGRPGRCSAWAPPPRTCSMRRRVVSPGPSAGTSAQGGPLRPTERPGGALKRPTPPIRVEGRWRATSRSRRCCGPRVWARATRREDAAPLAARRSCVQDGGCTRHSSMTPGPPLRDERLPAKIGGIQTMLGSSGAGEPRRSGATTPHADAPAWDADQPSCREDTRAGALAHPGPVRRIERSPTRSGPTWFCSTGLPVGLVDPTAPAVRGVLNGAESRSGSPDGSVDAARRGCGGQGWCGGGRDPWRRRRAPAGLQRRGAPG